MLKYMDDWFGLVDTETDSAYIMDDYGNAVSVFWLFNFDYYQDH